MGNTTSNADFECCIEAKDFKLIKKIKDKHFGEISHMKGNKTEDIVLMKELEFPDQDTYHNMIEDYSYYTSLRHNNLATIYGFTGADNHELFKNTSHKICIYFEYLQNTLESVLSKKKVQLASGNKQGSPENFYGELEMFKMMSYLVNPLEYLQQNGVSHGDIRPSSCFIDNKGNIKLYNRKLLCEKETAFHKAKNGDNTLFLTPFEFECLGKQKSEPVQDQYKADVFRLGMTLMECATLKKSVQIYDWNNYTMNLNILSVRLLEVKQRYSPFIYEMLREMLRFEESKRPDFATLKHYLIEEGKTNLSLVSVHHVDEEDHLLKELIMGMESKTVLPSRSNSSGEGYNAFFQKSIANSGSSKPEPKRIPIGETPQLTKETARDYAACSIPSTYREENIQEDLLESQPHVKINEIQNQSLVPVSKKFRTMNCDLTSILMNTSASEIRANPHIGAGVIERKTPEADLSILSKKGVDDMQEVSQVVIESPESKSRDTPVLSLNSPVVIEDTYSSYKKDTSNPVHMKDYPSLGRYGGSSAIYEKHSSHQNYALDISAAMAKADMIQQKIQESLERARKCRESIYKGDVKDQLNSSTATFGADNHDMVNEKLYSSEYRYSTGRDTKRPSSRANLVQPGSATRDSRAKSSGRSTIYKYQSAKKEPIPSLFDSTYRPEISEQSIENSDPCPFTPVFSAGKGKRSVSSNRGIKRVADPYDIIPERENSSAIPIQKILSIATPEKLRNYSEMYERNLRLSDLKKEASTEEFDSESSPWNNLHLLEQEQSNNLSKQVELLRHADPQTEETFQKAMERTQQTREVIKMIEAKSRASLAKKGLYII